MHPYQQLTLAQQHMTDLQTSARRHRLARAARRLRRPEARAPESRR